MTAAELPDVLTVADLAAFLGISERSLRERRELKSWPFSPIKGFPRKGKAARYSKAHVLAVIHGGAVRHSAA
jgi:hypothetical protein